MASPKKQRGIIRRILFWLFLGGLAAAVVYGLKPRPLSVDTATVENGPLTVAVIEEGKTRIRHRHVISPPVSGNLRRVELRAGAPIKAGETRLAVIEAATSNFLDPRTSAEAEARIAATEAVREAKQADLDRSEAALQLAKRQLERQQKLAATGAAAAQDLDIALAEAQVRQRERNAAEFALRAAASDVDVAKAALLQARAPSSEQSKPIEIIAPVDGFVLNVYEESARPVTAGMPIMEVGDPTDLEAEIELLSSDAAGVKPGAEVWIEQWGGEKPLLGKVSVVEPGGFTKLSALGVEEQRVITRVDFVDPVPEGFTLGDRYRVEARIVTWKTADTLLVPTGALFREGNEWKAFVVDQDVAKKVAVQIGKTDGVHAQVLGGLRKDQRVILHPPESVKEGVKLAPQS